MVFSLNGERLNFEAHPLLPLSVFLRDHLEISSLGGSCYGRCTGSCLVLQDNQCVWACQIPFFQLANREILTAEGFAQQNPKLFQAILAGLKESCVYLCPLCAPSRLLSFGRLLWLDKTPMQPETVEQFIGLVRCLCTGPTLLREGIKKAASYVNFEKKHPALPPVGKMGSKQRKLSSYT